MEIAERHAGETDDSKGAEETKTVRVAVCVLKRGIKKETSRTRRGGDGRGSGRLEEEGKEGRPAYR